MPNSPYTARAATPADLDTLAAFILAEAAEAEGAAKAPETVRAGISAGLNDPAIARYWVLQSGAGEVIGSISVVREWSDWHAGFYWWIQSMFITPEYRGQGLMPLLLDAVRAAARAEKALELRLYVHRDNGRAIRAYRKAGFGDLPYQIMSLAP
ncbi:MAG: GNAT family N-acetyltransferase [Anaerolineae bacterium]